MIFYCAELDEVMIHTGKDFDGERVIEHYLVAPWLSAIINTTALEFNYEWTFVGYL